MNVEFGYGRIKGVHRKTILKHLKVDLYISSYPIQKKAVSKQGEKYQRKKNAVSKTEETKIIHKICRKNRFWGWQNETVLLKNTEKSVYRKSTYNSSSVCGNYNCAELCTDILIMPSKLMAFKFALLYQLYKQQLLFIPFYQFWFNFMNSFSFFKFFRLIFLTLTVYFPF